MKLIQIKILREDCEINTNKKILREDCEINTNKKILREDCEIIQIKYSQKTVKEMVNNKKTNTRRSLWWKT